MTLIDRRRGLILAHKKISRSSVVVGVLCILGGQLRVVILAATEIPTERSRAAALDHNDDAADEGAHYAAEQQEQGECVITPAETRERCQDKLLLDAERAHGKSRIDVDVDFLVFPQAHIQPAIGFPHNGQRSWPHPDDEAFVLDTLLLSSDAWVSLVEPGRARAGRVVLRVSHDIHVRPPSCSLEVDRHSRDLKRVIEDACGHQTTGHDLLTVHSLACRLDAAALAKALVNLLPMQLLLHLRLDVAVKILVEGADLIVEQDGWLHVLRRLHLDDAAVASGRLRVIHGTPHIVNLVLIEGGEEPGRRLVGAIVVHPDLAHRLGKPERPAPERCQQEATNERDPQHELPRKDERLAGKLLLGEEREVKIVLLEDLACEPLRTAFGSGSAYTAFGVFLVSVKARI
mmetsp:Transcript_34636/g.75318  ORF Transcript_34636/g.75318 Transcript_34636/m.75318 type:complete len:403 (-) Transcript_34636:898-2106(-)